MTLEQQIRAAIADGWPTKEIAETFDVSAGQVHKRFGGGGMDGPEFASFRAQKDRLIQQAKKHHIDLKGL